jgi:hypothetical protein
VPAGRSPEKAAPKFDRHPNVNDRCQVRLVPAPRNVRNVHDAVLCDWGASARREGARPPCAPPRSSAPRHVLRLAFHGPRGAGDLTSGVGAQADQACGHRVLPRFTQKRRHRFVRDRGSAGGVMDDGTNLWNKSLHAAFRGCRGTVFCARVCVARGLREGREWGVRKQGAGQRQPGCRPEN